MFFPQTLSALVMNVKLEWLLDSQAPQTEHVYAYVDDDWGEAYEDKYEAYEDEHDNQWETSDKDDQNYEMEDTYATEEIR